MDNPFDQFDTPAASTNPFDQFDAPATFTKTSTPAIKPGDVEARRKLGELQAAQEPQNVSRERQTIGGEISGGIEQTMNDLGMAFRPLDKMNRKENGGMVLDALERAAYVGRSGLGVLRTLAPILSLGTSPMLSNLAAGAGESVSDALAKRGHTTLADVLGSLTSATLDVAPNAAGAEAINKYVRPAIAAKFPNMAEKVAGMKSALDAEEGTVNAASAAERASAERAKAAVEARLRSAKSNAESGVSSEASIADAAATNARNEAARVKAGITTKEGLEAMAPSKHSSQDVGASFQEHYNTKLAESENYFKPKYDQIEAEAAKVKTNAENYNEAAYRVGKQGAPSGIATTGGERAAATAEGALAEDVPALRTGADLIKEQRRLKDLERNAYGSGNDNLGRQYRELQEALGKDIEALPSSTARDLAAVNKEYATKHVPFFGSDSEIRAAAEAGPEAVVDKLIPKKTDALRGEKVDRLLQFVDKPEQQKSIGDAFIKNLTGDASNASGELNLSKLSSKWGQYADSRSGDKVLKSVLGDRYEGMRKLVQSAEGATTQSTDALLDKAISQIDKTFKARSSIYNKTAENVSKEQLAKLNTLKGVLGEGEQVIEGFKAPAKVGSLETERAVKIDALRKEFNDKLKEMGVKPFSENAGQLVGSAMILHGLVGGLAGHAAVAGAQAMSGFGIMLAAPTFFKLISKARGLELMNRAMRAAPGTANAYAAARTIKSYLKEIEKED